MLNTFSHWIKGIGYSLKSQFDLTFITLLILLGITQGWVRGRELACTQQNRALFLKFSILEKGIIFATHLSLLALCSLLSSVMVPNLYQLK